MSIQVKSIDVYSIHERLRKDKTKEGKEVWNYVKKLNEALTRQQELTGHCIKKLRQKLPLTERQLWFLNCAIEAKDAVLPLHPNSLSDSTFEASYGMTKEEVEKEITNLKELLH